MNVAAARVLLIYFDHQPIFLSNLIQRFSVGCQNFLHAFLVIVFFRFPYTYLLLTSCTFVGIRFEFVKVILMSFFQKAKHEQDDI